MDVDIPIHDDQPVPSPSRHPHSLQEEGDTHVTEVIRIDQSVHAKWRLQFGLCNEAESSVPEDQDDDRLDWQVKDCLGLAYHNTHSVPPAKWQSTFLAFADKPDHKHELHYRNPVDAIRTLLGNPAHAKDIIYKPATVFTDDTHSSRIYNEMWTGRWWHAIQCQSLLLLTKPSLQDSWHQNPYPVYLTLGNIPRAIHENQGNTLRGFARVHCLFHASLRIILDPLKEAGKEGIEVVGGDGLVHMVFPSLPAMLDYPQQCLVTCTKYGTCPKCRARAEELAEIQMFTRCTQPWTASIIDNANISTTTNVAFRKQCVFEPFWLEFPHCDIHLAII
ncbi:hypothetical protein DFH29DRAFT_983755 [Suillus ampliporus]|nr:hypothetical protein DFH29DRAFT_983755 [Suillus ampliporus]